MELLKISIQFELTIVVESFNQIKIFSLISQYAEIRIVFVRLNYSTRVVQTFGDGYLASKHCKKIGIKF